MSNNNEPAFPAPYSAEHHSAGLTKRDLIAAMAMQGLAVNDLMSDKHAAERAVLLADALLEALNG